MQEGERRAGYDACPFLSAPTLFGRARRHARTARQERPMLDVLYVAIGIAAFAVTVLYLPACDHL